MNLSKLKMQKISKKVVRLLLEDNQWVANDELASKFNIIHQTYLHPDGRVLNVLNNGVGRLYPTRQEFDRLLQLIETAKKRETYHVLEGRLPQGEAFIEHVPALIDELASLLKIERVELDGTVESLLKVEKKVKHRGREKCIETPIFPALVAYIGEVMRLAINGKWEMRLDAYKQTTWEPWVVDSQGRQCNPWLDLYDMLYESSEGISIVGSTGRRITSRRVPSNPQYQSFTTIIVNKTDKK